MAEVVMYRVRNWLSNIMARLRGRYPVKWKDYDVHDWDGDTVAVRRDARMSE